MYSCTYSLLERQKIEAMEKLLIRVNNYRLFILEKDQSSKLYYHITLIFIHI